MAEAGRVDADMNDPDRPVNGASPEAVSLFRSPFMRLWTAMVVSSLGDWIGFVAVASLAARIGGSSADAAVGIVLSARLIPGFFLGSAAGVFVDRWDRKRVMVVCDIGRATVMATLPFVNSILGLFAASLVLELLTLMWSAAKEASIPNLVRQESLSHANGLSLAAAYGTFPIGSAAFAFLAKAAEWLGSHDSLHFLELNQESLAIYVDVVTFLFSAIVISTLVLPRHERTSEVMQISFHQTMDELRDGWRFIGTTPLVRAVIVGIATGLIGAGLVIPLGPVFASVVLGGGPAAYGFLLFALGTGVAVGVIGVSVVQRRLPHERLFVGAVIGSGVFMLAAATMSSLTPALILVAGMGLCGGGVYVLGLSLLQANVVDELRGRIFATFYVLGRFSLLVALALGPLVSSLLDSLSRRFVDRDIVVGVLRVALPGARLTLWLGGAIIVAAGLLVARSCWDIPIPAEPVEPEDIE